MHEIDYQPRPLADPLEIAYLADTYEDSDGFIGHVYLRHAPIYEALKRDAAAPMPTGSTLPADLFAPGKQTAVCDLEPHDWKLVGLLAWAVVGGVCLLAPDRIGLWLLIPIVSGIIAQLCSTERTTTPQGVIRDNDR